MTCQHALEAATRHAAVLRHEQAEQLKVDTERDRCRPDRAGIDTPGNDDAADETDGVKQRDDKDRINGRAVADAEKPHQTSRRQPADAGLPMLDSNGHDISSPV
jgi:hypothetical protein